MMSALRYVVLCLSLLFLISACSDTAEEPAAPESETQAPGEPDPLQTLIERGKRLELDTEYVPPPGDPMAHYTMGFARTLCSAVFVTGLDPEFAAESVGYFTSPYETRSVVVNRDVDFENKTVRLTMENGVVRTAKYIGDLGSVTLPIAQTEPYYDPPTIESTLPDPATTPWPMGDMLSDEPMADEIVQGKLAEAVDTVFMPGAMTAAFVVTHKGRIIAERYGDGIDMHTALESWSMGKSLTATLMGVLIQQGVYDLWQAAPIPEWQEEGDPRQKIRIGDIMRMSSGLRCRGPADPDADPSEGYFDHHYLYTGTVNSFEYAATRPQQWEPNTVGRYRNCDPVLTNYLIRMGVEGRGDEYHQFPQQHLFDKIGVRNFVFQTDPYGNILLQGSDLGSARDWARIGNLYLNDGVAEGERILPEGFADFVSTVAPAWEADGRPIYGAFFWLQGPTYGLPREDMYGMGGAGGQMTVMVPSREMVVVRLGHYKGSPIWGEARPKGIQLLLEAVPAH